VVAEKNGTPTGLAMINGKLQEFARHVVAKGQMGYGDVRRLERDYLPNGITNGEELESLISLNATLVRADKAWAQWLVASMKEFFAERGLCGDPIQKAAGEWAGHLLATSTTSLGRRIARQLRRALGRTEGNAATKERPRPEGIRSDDVRQPSQPEAPANVVDDCSLQMDCSLRIAKPPGCEREESQPQSGQPRPRVRHATKPAVTRPSADTYGWGPAGYLTAVQRSHMINFQSSRVSVVLAPCR
jgi:hypothetical protein